MKKAWTVICFSAIAIVYLAMLTIEYLKGNDLDDFDHDLFID